MTADRPHPPLRPGLAVALLSATLALGAPGAHAANRSWLNAVSGSAGTASLWSPAVAPTYLDTALLYGNGTHTISWASPQDTLSAMYSYGTPTLSVSGTLGVQGTFDVVSGELGIGTGTIRARQVVVGADGATGTLRVSGGLASNGSVVSASTSLPLMLANAGSVTNGFDRANVYLTGGGTLLGNGRIETSRSTFTSTHVYVSGSHNYFGAVYRSTFGTLSAAGGGGRGDVVLGAGGGVTSNTTVDVFDGGVLDVKGALYAGLGGGGTLHLYESVAGTNPRAYVYGKTYVGDDPTTAAARPGHLFIDGGTALLGGTLFIGDVDHPSGSTDGTGLVRISGGRTVLGGPIVMTNALGGTLEMTGGTLRFLSGVSEIRQDPAFDLSGGSAAPEMTVNSGANVHLYNTAPDPIALGVGRGGSGLLRMAGSNAQVVAHGDVAIADSVGGAGIVQVDSAGAFTSTGLTYVGPGGQLRVTNGSAVVSTIDCEGLLAIDTGHVYGSGVITATGTLSGNGILDGTWQNLGTIDLPGAPLQVGELQNVGGVFTGGGTLAVGTALHASGAADMSVDASGARLYPHDYPVPPASGARRGADAASIVRGARRAGALDDPEAPLGHLHLGGSLTLSSASTTILRIGSAASGARDSLEVDGNASLDGTLELVSIAGDAPAPGDTITVLGAGSVSGTFASVTLDGMDASGEVAVLYSATDVKVVVLGTTGVGDAGSGISQLRFSAARHRGAAAVVLELPSAARVRVTVYDVGGREVARLADDTYPGGGRFEYPLPGMASGMYFAHARIESASGRIERTARVAVLR